MAYAVKWNDTPSKGPTADEWFTALRKEGWNERLPFDDKAELEDDNADFWRAFWELTASRRIGLGMGAIPYSEITDWLNEEQIIPVEDRVFYRRILSALDRAYLKQIGTKDKGNNAKGNRNSPIHRQSKGQNRR